MRFLLTLLLAACLLTGCQTSPVPEYEPAATAPEEAVPASFYDPDDPLQAQTGGAVRVYVPDVPDVYGLRRMDDGLLLLSGDTYTTLTLVRGEDMSVAGRLKLPFRLEAEEPSLTVFRDQITYYDPLAREIRVLDAQLAPVSRIAAPEDLVGSPVLSGDGRTLYYCTASALRAWDLKSGIRRCVKDLSYDTQSVTGLHRDETVVECRITDGSRRRTLFLSAQDGQILAELRGDVTLTTAGDIYYAALPAGNLNTYVYGKDSPNALTPIELFAPARFLPEQNALLTIAAADTGTSLDLYDLTSGRRRAALAIDVPCAGDAALCAGGSVYLLSPRQTHTNILRWEPTLSPILDGNTYAGDYHPAEDPDQQALDRCQTYADQIAQRYGIRILIGEAAAETEPWDYDLEPELQPGVLDAQLKALEEWLLPYPETVLRQTAAQFSSLTISLVRQITGTAESGSLAAATGVQYLDGTDAYVAIAIGPYARQALYHELFHAMETRIWAESIAFDQWDDLNPTGFAYDYNYAANAQREAGVYLHPESRAFIDTYSMSYPKEDRARVMEYAMLEEAGSLFESTILQRKLQAVCDGIREAYDLEEYKDPLLWEQYLQ